MQIQRSITCAFLALAAFALGYPSKTFAQNTSQDKTAEVIRSGVIQPLSRANAVTVSDFWNDKAELILKRKLLDTRSYSSSVWPAQFGAGSHIVPGPDGAWNLFTRHVYWNVGENTSVPRLWGGNHYNSPGFCNSPHLIGTDVRKSWDQGKTWSAPRSVVIPKEGTDHECVGGEGDAIYDYESDKWIYLFQCGSRNGWKGCYLEFQGKDLLDSNIAWKPATAAGSSQSAVVINNGDLWKKICGPYAICGRIPQDYPQAGLQPVFDEGTFNIIKKDSQGFYWISFHGYDMINGYRGIAKTLDFVHYLAGDPSQGLPMDSIFDPFRLGQGWRENWQGWSKLSDLVSIVLNTEGNGVGGGGGQVYFEKETGEHYLLVEAADRNLACVPGQNWDVGLYRSESLSSFFWTPIPRGNPIFYSDHTPGPIGGHFPGKSFPCNTAYQRIFKDGSGKTYYHHFRDGEGSTETGLMLYQFAAKSNALRNSSLQRCDLAHWLSWNRTTSVALNRASGHSSDLGCSLSVKCTAGSACTTGESVFQDFPKSSLQNASIPKGFGGKFKSSKPGKVLVALFQIDANNRTISTESFQMNTSNTFKLQAAAFSLRSETSFLRFQLYPLTPDTEYFADEMFAGELVYFADEDLSS